MGILDDLKNQSEAQKADEDREQQHQAELLQYYSDNINPKMIELYSFFNEFIKHLNYVKNETIVQYPVTPDGSQQDFFQADYKVTIDSSKSVKEINLGFFCNLSEPLVFELENSKRIQRYVDVLQSYRVNFERTDNKNSNHELVSTKFKVIGPIAVNVIIQADIETSSINILFNNFDKPGSQKHIFKDRHITEEFIDGFGKYILRQNPEFLKLDINEEDKEKIRQNIKAEMKVRQQELDEADRLLKSEEEQKSEKKSWKDLFRKTD